MVDMQRFQVPYNLKPIPEVQEYLNILFQDSRHQNDLQDLYRRRNVFSYSFSAHADLLTVCWSNLNGPLIIPLPAICDSFSAGQLGRSLNHKLHN